jgi:hypothetical protein
MAEDAERSIDGSDGSRLAVRALEIFDRFGQLQGRDGQCAKRIFEPAQPTMDGRCATQRIGDDVAS